MHNNLPKNANTETFVGLLTANQRKIFAYIMSVIVNVNDSDDIMQETVKLMWKKFDEFRIGSDFLAWATTIAHYHVLEFRKQKRRNELVLTDDVFTCLQDQAATELQDSDDYLVYLNQCMSKLSTNDLGLVRMRYMNGLTVKQIASQFGRNLTSVYRSIARIQDLLRLCIKRQSALEELP